MTLNVYDVTLLKSKIEYIISTFIECPPLASVKVRISNLELKDDKYHISGDYECVTLFDNKVIRKGRFTIVINEKGKLYSAKVE